MSAQEKKDSDSYIIEPISSLMNHVENEIFDQLNKRNNSLYEALELAYRNNPSLRAARAELSSIQEQLPQAQAGFKPTITANANVIHTDTDEKGASPISSEGANTAKSASLDLSQPIFRGGSTLADVHKAKNTISARQLNLSAIEQSGIYEAVLVYMNVLRDRAILKLNQNNRALVARELAQVQNRFTVGELTRTDVSQSEARLANADANVITARGVFKSALASYRQIVGSPPPIDIAYPEKELSLPETLDEALKLAESNNREILSAKFISAAANDNIDSAFGRLLPQISATGSLNKTYDPNSFIDEMREASVGLSASVPLYQGGAVRSSVRQARKQANQRHLEILAVQNKIRQEVTTHWEGVQTAKAEILARQSQIKAAKIAQEGVHYEAEFGERTTLDVLDANQELLDSQVNLIAAKRNEIVKRFALARTLGVLVPQNLGFSSIENSEK